MWPALTKQGTSRKAQVSDFACTVTGINIINTHSLDASNQTECYQWGSVVTFYKSMSWRVQNEQFSNEQEEKQFILRDTEKEV